MKVSRFTPSLMKHEDLEEIFVQRHKLAQNIVELIRDSVITLSKHHTLLIGPRGIGKTHLVSLVYYRIREMDDLGDRLLIAWLREEEWGVTSFLDLLLRIFRALQEESEGRGVKSCVPTERVESLYELSSDAAERAGAELLKEVIGDRTLLLLMENLDEVFAGLGDEGQRRLRAFLQENVCCTILATSQSLFNGVKLQTSPFYGFFRIWHLEDLTSEDATQLLANIARLEGQPDLELFIRTRTGGDRIRAVHHLAGGSHRVYVIFSEFLTCESLDELVEPFMRTLDDLTPYYQARMAYLSPQQRKIIEFLCDRRHAVPVKEIAQRCFMTHQTASGQLKDLREKGYVTSEAIGRESYYELREPLMRFCLEVKKQRGEPIQLFVNFLRLWYTRTELQQRLKLLPDETLEREYLLKALQAAEEDGEDPRVIACLKEYQDYFEQKDFVHALQIAERLVVIRGQAWEWTAQGRCLFLLGRDKEALVSFDKAIEVDSYYARAWCRRGSVLNEIGRYKEALVSYDKAIELNPNDALAWLNKALVLVNLKRCDQAWTSLDKAIELNVSQSKALFNRGYLLGKLGRYEAAIASFDKVIELYEKQTLACEYHDYVIAWNNRGWLLCRLGRYDQALMSLEKALALDYQRWHCFFNRAESLLALNRWDEGIIALDEALHSFADVAPNTDNTEAIIRNLFNSKHDAAIWKTRITTLIELYEKYKVVVTLGQGLVGIIPALMSEMVSDKAAQTWLEVWRELVSDIPEFQIPLRLLNAAVRYRETKGDKRVLLELPIEERNLLKPLLGISEGGQ